MEAMLILPVIMILFGAIAQVMITSQTRVFVEQAAYAAARSALVYNCRPLEIGCTSQRRKWEDAARWALVPAAATVPGSSCQNILAGEQILSAGNKIAGRDSAANNALCYAFDPSNVIVTVDWVLLSPSSAAGTDHIPITATVEFRAPLATPFRRFVRETTTGSGISSNGTYWRWVTASVTLL
jgi:hypothetical protein